MTHKITISVLLPAAVTVEAEWDGGHVTVCCVLEAVVDPTCYEIEESFEDELASALRKVAGPPPVQEET